MVAKNNTIHAVGRRKTSVARANITKGTGIYRINNEDASSYLTNEMLLLKSKEPLFIAELDSKVDVMVKVFGGGTSSQVDSIRQAIARALLEMTGKDELKKKFLEYDRSLLVTDTRFKEMKKPNNSSARSKRQKSYR